MIDPILEKMVDQLQENFFNFLNSDIDKENCSGGCIWGEVCKFDVCAVKLHFEGKPLPKACQDLLDESDRQDEEYWKWVRENEIPYDDTTV